MPRLFSRLPGSELDSGTARCALDDPCDDMNGPTMSPSSQQTGPFLALTAVTVRTFIAQTGWLSAKLLISAVWIGQSVRVGCS